MSETLTPVAPPQPAAPPANAPPPEGEPFAPVLAAAAQDAAPPGDQAQATSTRSATAEGAEAGSDSSAPDQPNELDNTELRSAELRNAELRSAAQVLPTDAAVAFAAAAVPLAPPTPAGISSAQPAESAPVPPQSAAGAPAVGWNSTPPPTVPPSLPTVPDDSTQGATIPTAAPRQGTGSPTTGAAGPLPAPASMPAQVVDQQIVQPEVAAQPALPKPEAGERPLGTATAEHDALRPVGEQPQLTRRAEVSGRDDAPAPALPPMSAAVAAVQPSAVQPGAVQPSAVQPSAAEPAATLRPQAPVPLHELPQAAEAAIRLSVRDNRTLAHITVHPEELGPVEIRLRYDENGGITASVQAGSAEAARMLADAVPDLRRALETQGLSLLGFDVRSDGRDADRGRDVPDAPQGSRREPGEPDPEPAELHLPKHVPDYFPNHGAHVDVLA